MGSILDRNFDHLDGYFTSKMSSKFDQNVRKFHRKNIFSPKILFSLKTYSDSSLNTEYEPLTPKTERVSSNFPPKIMKMTISNEKIVKFGHFWNIEISRSKNNFRQKIDLCPKTNPVPGRYAKYERAGAKIERASPKSRFRFLTIFSSFFFPRTTSQATQYGQIRLK